MKDNILQTLYVYLQFNHCDIIGLKIYRIRWKKRKITAIAQFKVNEVGTNRKAVCDFLLVINRNWPPIWYRFGVIAAYSSNFEHFAFLSPLWRPYGLRTTFVLGSLGVVDFLLVLIELFRYVLYGWVATREKRSKIGDFPPTRSVWSKISGTRGGPSNHFCTDSQANERLTTLPLTVFT